ncbi:MULTISPECIES: DUF975 family protein [Bacilli]|uniref:DUF975 family protein n=1 Tax=Bacilli TaxID=91061 RepID=UPI001593550C|nr:MULTISPECIES: DUF975 family protein [Bacilli]MCH1736585.1 DUF975 family protein [Enterococcus faecalis]MDT2061433.1 DUF975 family protein [Enterococcus faecalis]MDV7842912.1 DUF975 family protein [Enterococcus faecalis]NVE20715.1 DUF975 family protein [Staphylococcus aureus]
MKKNFELKIEAKQMLRGRWKDSILMSIMPTLISIIAVGIFIILVVIPTAYLFKDLPSYYSNGMVNSVVTENGASSSSRGFVSGLISIYFTTSISWTFLDIFRGTRITIEPFKNVLRSFKSPYLIAVLILYLLTTIFKTLWTFLFLIPGIIKSYSYSQTYMIYYDTIQQTGHEPKYLETITASRELMHGHKWQLFLLDISFIGWHILSVVTLGIGYLWLIPYIRATKVAFYNNLSNKKGF